MSKDPDGHSLSASELDRLRRALVAKRDALLEAQRSSLEAQRGVGERESEAGDEAETSIEQEGALRLGAFDAALLAAVERALAKMEEGRYGVSEESGKPIPLARLEAVPWARRTAGEEEARRA